MLGSIVKMASMKLFGPLFRHCNKKYNHNLVLTYFNTRTVIFQKSCFTRLPSITEMTCFSFIEKRHLKTTATILKKIEIKNEVKQTCWKCGKELNPSDNQFICPCGVLQPPVQNRTFFEIMGIDLGFRINATELTRKFRNLQSILHPDKFSTKSEIEKEHSETQSSLVNKAYQTLLKPLPRGLYMLNLFGESIEEGETQMEMNFLMEIMEKNEEIDSAISLNELEAIEDDNDKTVDILIKEIEVAFNNQDITLAKSKLSELQYFCNIDSKIKDKKQEIH